MAKTRVAPKKTISVAKLELQAALLGARMAKMLVKELTTSIRRRRFWTDSSCVRNWLRTTASHYKPFVSHRIGEMQTFTESGEWRFVPGTQNPADWATRSTLTADPIISPDCIEGPKFFKLAESRMAKRSTLDEGEDGDQNSKWKPAGELLWCIILCYAFNTLRCLENLWTNLDRREIYKPKYQCSVIQREERLARYCNSWKKSGLDKEDSTRCKTHSTRV